MWERDREGEMPLGLELTPSVGGSSLLIDLDGPEAGLRANDKWNQKVM